MTIKVQINSLTIHNFINSSKSIYFFWIFFQNVKFLTIHNSSIQYWDLTSTAMQFNTEKGLFPFLLGQFYCHPVLLICAQILKYQFLLICLYFDYISSTKPEICVFIILLHGGVTKLIATRTNDKAAMSKLFAWKYRSIITIFKIVGVGSKYISDT